MNHQVNRPRIADENIDGEVIIIDFDSGCYFSTSDMGSLVWDLIDKGVDSDDIVRTVTEHYGDIAREGRRKGHSTLHQRPGAGRAHRFSGKRPQPGSRRKCRT